MQSLRTDIYSSQCKKKCWVTVKGPSESVVAGEDKIKNKNVHITLTLLFISWNISSEKISVFFFFYIETVSVFRSLEELELWEAGRCSKAFTQTNLNIKKKEKVMFCSKYIQS